MPVTSDSRYSPAVDRSRDDINRALRTVADRLFVTEEVKESAIDAVLYVVVLPRLLHWFSPEIGILSFMLGGLTVWVARQLSVYKTHRRRSGQWIIDNFLRERKLAVINETEANLKKVK